MNKTGTYKWDPKQQKLVKISDRVPDTCVFDCYVPKGGYLSTNSGHRPQFFASRNDKRKALAKAGLREQTDLTKREI